MREPLFKAEDYVLHKSTGKIARVVKVFPNEEGFRYYVEHSGHVWSVAESHIDSAESKYAQISILQNQQVTEQEFPKTPRLKRSGNA